MPNPPAASAAVQRSVRCLAGEIGSWCLSGAGRAAPVAAGFPLAVSTTTTPENVTALLEHALDPEAMSWFEVIAAGDVVPAKKPAPDIYHYAMEHLGLAPEQCIAFEDSHNGILSSRGADLKTIIAVNGYTEDDDFTGAEIVLNHWGDPDNPFTVLQGDAGGSTTLDLELVKRLHGG